MLRFMPLDYSSTKGWSCSWPERVFNTAGIPERIRGYKFHYPALLRDRHRRADRGVFEKPNRHLSGQPNATMRCGKGWNIALMHRVTASEKHRIRHSGAIEMRTFRLGILSRIDIGPDDVPITVHVIAKHRRDVARIL